MTFHASPWAKVDESAKAHVEIVLRLIPDYLDMQASLSVSTSLIETSGKLNPNRTYHIQQTLCTNKLANPNTTLLFRLNPVL